MVVLAVVTTIALCLLLDWLSRDRHPEPTVCLPAGAREPGLDPPELVGDIQVQLDMCYHPAHSWALAVGPDRVRIGVDAFALQVLGPFNSIDLPRPGSSVVQGRPAWNLCRGGCRAPVLSPVSGRVAAVNSLVAVQPQVLQGDPFGQGWLLEVQTADITTSFNNLLRGAVVCRWQAEAIARTRSRGWYSKMSASSEMPPAWWSQAVQEILYTDSRDADRIQGFGGEDGAH